MLLMLSGLAESAGKLHLQGSKGFASGAGSLKRPIVTVEIENEGRVMCLLPMETIQPAIDFNSWHPLGMEGSDSFTVDFSGMIVDSSLLLGGAGDYYKQPAFSGGRHPFRGRPIRSHRAAGPLF